MNRPIFYEFKARFSADDSDKLADLGLLVQTEVDSFCFDIHQLSAFNPGSDPNETRIILKNGYGINLLINYYEFKGIIEDIFQTKRFVNANR